MDGECVVPALGSLGLFLMWPSSYHRAHGHQLLVGWCGARSLRRHKVEMGVCPQRETIWASSGSARLARIRGAAGPA